MDSEQNALFAAWSGFVDLSEQVFQDNIPRAPETEQTNEMPRHTQKLKSVGAKSDSGAPYWVPVQRRHITDEGTEDSLGSASASEELWNRILEVKSPNIILTKLKLDIWINFLDEKGDVLFKIQVPKTLKAKRREELNAFVEDKAFKLNSDSLLSWPNIKRMEQARILLDGLVTMFSRHQHQLMFSRHQFIEEKRKDSCVILHDDMKTFSLNTENRVIIPNEKLCRENLMRGKFVFVLPEKFQLKTTEEILNRVTTGFTLEAGKDVPKQRNPEFLVEEIRDEPEGYIKKKYTFSRIEYEIIVFRKREVKGGLPLIYGRHLHESVFYKLSKEALEKALMKAKIVLPPF
eukprot:GHVP01008547.1.p1 GENE.GHVP01008547.1~~GHVP01008547.1.p1  ORF type:complete len:347 (+),score=62.68 GHVP01008547.1:87-1127(+)